MRGWLWSLPVLLSGAACGQKVAMEADHRGDARDPWTVATGEGDVALDLSTGLSPGGVPAGQIFAARLYYNAPPQEGQLGSTYVDLTLHDLPDDGPHYPILGREHLKLDYGVAQDHCGINATKSFKLWVEAAPRDFHGVGQTDYGIHVRRAEGGRQIVAGPWNWQGSKAVEGGQYKGPCTSELGRAHPGCHTYVIDVTRRQDHYDFFACLGFERATSGGGSDPDDPAAKRVTLSVFPTGWTDNAFRYAANMGFVSISFKTKPGGTPPNTSYPVCSSLPQSSRGILCTYNGRQQTSYLPGVQCNVNLGSCTPYPGYTQSVCDDMRSQCGGQPPAGSPVVVQTPPPAQTPSPVRTPPPIAPPVQVATPNPVQPVVDPNAVDPVFAERFNALTGSLLGRSADAGLLRLGRDVATRNGRMACAAKFLVDSNEGKSWYIANEWSLSGRPEPRRTLKDQDSGVAWFSGVFDRLGYAEGRMQMWYGISNGEADVGQFVRTLYWRILGRQAAPGEVGAWADQVGRVGRESVARSINSATESRARMVAVMLYMMNLDPRDPSRRGTIEDWAQRMARSGDYSTTAAQLFGLVYLQDRAIDQPLTCR
jgi:hypothetical protein